jgi:DNA-binding MarR family transcriptional regulator
MARCVNEKSGCLSDQLRAWELSPAQFDVIAQVGASRGITQRELAGRLVVTEGNVTQLLDKLERQGLVERHAEGRCNQLKLTDAGRLLYARVVPEHEELIAQQFAVLSAAEKDELSRLLRKISRGSG